MAEALIKWSDTYNLGLKEIDEQHKSLLDLINKIWQSIIDRNEKDVVFGLVEELERYTLAHFAAEETFMRVTDFQPGLHAFSPRQHEKRIPDVPACVQQNQGSL